MKVRNYDFAWAAGIKTLYKFRSFQGESIKWVEQILLESKIYMAHPEEFNDPFDIAPVVAHSGNPKSRRYIEKLQKEELRFYQEQGYSAAEVDEMRLKTGVTAENLAAAAAQDLREKLRNAARILCLSGNERNSLQWAHYANGHQGVCIHFKCSRLGWLRGARKVRYRRQRPPVLLPLSELSTVEFANRLVLTKAAYWSYEKEYRLFANHDSRSEVQLTDDFAHFAQSDLTGITIALAMSKQDRQALLQMLSRRRQNLPVWECIEHPTRYELTIRQLRAI